MNRILLLLLLPLVLSSCYWSPHTKRDKYDGKLYFLGNIFEDLDAHYFGGIEPVGNKCRILLDQAISDSDREAQGLSPIGKTETAFYLRNCDAAETSALFMKRFGLPLKYEGDDIKNAPPEYYELHARSDGIRYSFKEESLHKSRFYVLFITPDKNDRRYCRFYRLVSFSAANGKFHYEGEFEGYSGTYLSGKDMAIFVDAFLIYGNFGGMFKHQSKPVSYVSWHRPGNQKQIPTEMFYELSNGKDFESLKLSLPPNEIMLETKSSFYGDYEKYLKYLRSKIIPFTNADEIIVNFDCYMPDPVSFYSYLEDSAYYPHERRENLDKIKTEVLRLAKLCNIKNVIFAPSVCDIYKD